MDTGFAGTSMGLEHAGTLWTGIAWFLFTVRADDHSKRSRGISRDYADATDEELMGRSTGGDTRAFDAIVLRHAPFLLRVARRLVPDGAFAQDVVQEALVRAWTKAARFDARRARLRTWLYRIVVNLCVDHGRRTSSEPLPENFEPVDPAPSANDQLEADERQTALAAAIEALPVRQRAALTLVYDEGLSGAEAADVLGVSAKAVERLLARARAELGACLRSEQWEVGS
jgi:RNA polymerase sigma-70 factor (ECF subfamily)